MDKYNAYIASSDKTDEALVANPLYFTRSGYVSDGNQTSPGYGDLHVPGHGAYYWSSTVGNGYVYRLVFRSGFSNPASYDYRGYGLSVRCIAR